MAIIGKYPHSSEEIADLVRNARTALPYVVEVKGVGLFDPRWKPIAAFKSEWAAEAYRDQCRAECAPLEYRMRDLTPSVTQ